MGLIFICNYCSKECLSFGDLIRHYETHKNEKEYRSLRDAINYNKADSGCQQATNYLGYQSSCLLCPFPKCILDKPGVGFARAKKAIRNEEIIKLFKEGISIPDLARVFDVSKRTIQRAVKKGR